MLNKLNYLRLLTILAVLAVLAFSTQEALANFSNGTENPGPIVMRYEDEFGVFYSDPNAGLIAIHGVDVVKWCLGELQDWDFVAYHNILSPSDEFRKFEFIHGGDTKLPSGQLRG